jgi:hypothetical protein
MTGAIAHIDKRGRRSRTMLVAGALARRQA